MMTTTFAQLFVALALIASVANAKKKETITGTIFCDNSFKFWFNGELIANDTLDFAPHNALNVSFEWDGKSDKVYAIQCEDYQNEDYNTGYEYVKVPIYEDGKCCWLNNETLKFDDCEVMDASSCPQSCPPNLGIGAWELPGGIAPSDRCDADGNCKGCGPWIGDGALLAEFSDGTRTSRDWKVFTTSFGPTDESILNGCSYKDFSECELELTPTPTDWFDPCFDDGDWVNASEFTVLETSWGRTPFYNETSGECSILMGQNRKPQNPNGIVMPADQCVNPKEVLCEGTGGADCPGKNCATDGPQCNGTQYGTPIWAEDLQRAQQNLFRFTVPGTKKPKCKDDKDDDEDED